MKKIDESKLSKLLLISCILIMLSLTSGTIWLVVGVLDFFGETGKMVLTETTLGQFVDFQEEILENKNFKSTDYKVQYTYVVDGKEYEATSIQKTSDTNSDNWQNLMVYYNPNNPSQSKLDFEVNRLTDFFIIFAVLTVLLMGSGLAILWYIFSNLKKIEKSNTL